MLETTVILGLCALQVFAAITRSFPNVKVSSTAIVLTVVPPRTTLVVVNGGGIQTPAELFGLLLALAFIGVNIIFILRSIYAQDKSLRKSADHTTE